MELELALERCKKSIIDSISQIRGEVNKAQIEYLEKIAHSIIQSMSGAWRFFHTPEHIFEVGDDGDAVEILSALFHDMIYVQVDSGININLSGYIYPYVRESNNQFYILPNSELPEERVFTLILTVFGFSPGQILSPFGGQNEFLSTLVALKSLEQLLNEDVLVEIAACIETTIPFRKKNDKGESPQDILKQRLIFINENYKFGWDEEKINSIIRRSVRMANRDIETFGSPNPIKFLDNTWNLMPETNHELGSPNRYTITGYRISMMKMEMFMHMVYPEIIFHQFMDEPSDEKLQFLYKNTYRNLEVAKLYIGSKLVTVVILEALSLRIGRSLTLSTLIGELPKDGMPTVTLDLFLPQIEKPFRAETEIEKEVMEILINGRNQDSPYDLKNSPIATFLVQAVGFLEVRRLISLSKEFFVNKITAEKFLSECDSFVLTCLVQGVIKLFEYRTDNLRKLKSELFIN